MCSWWSLAGGHWQDAFLSWPKAWDQLEEGILDKNLNLQGGLPTKFPGEEEKGGPIPHPAPLPTGNSGKTLKRRGWQRGKSPVTGRTAWWLPNLAGNILTSWLGSPASRHQRGKHTVWYRWVPLPAWGWITYHPLGTVLNLSKNNHRVSVLRLLPPSPQSTSTPELILLPPYDQVFTLVQELQQVLFFISILLSTNMRERA